MQNQSPDILFPVFDMNFCLFPKTHSLHVKICEGPCNHGKNLSKTCAFDCSSVLVCLYGAIRCILKSQNYAESIARRTFPLFYMHFCLSPKTHSLHGKICEGPCNHVKSCQKSVLLIVPVDWCVYMGQSDAF